MDHPSAALHGSAWTADESTIVLDAITATEQRLRLPVPGTSAKPWLCFKEELGDRALFIASRFGVAVIFSARNAGVLADKIRGMPGTGPPDLW